MTSTTTTTYAALDAEWGEAGGWHDAALVDLLARLDAVDGGFDGVGFDSHDLDDLRALLEGVDDLDDIADGYDPDDPGNLPVLRLQVERGVMDRWKVHAAGYTTDTEALSALFADA